MKLTKYEADVHDILSDVTGYQFNKYEDEDGDVCYDLIDPYGDVDGDPIYEFEDLVHYISNNEEIESAIYQLNNMEVTA